MRLSVTFIVLLLIAAGLAMGITVYFAFVSIGETVSQPDTCSLNEQCVLSLCDCSCYRFNQTVEILEDKECGKNCEELAGVSSCECQEQQCIAVS